MKNICLFYKYFFFKLFEFGEKAPSRWWSEWKAFCFLCIWEFMLLIIVQLYVLKHLGIQFDPNGTFRTFNFILLLVLAYFKYNRIMAKNQWASFKNELTNIRHNWSWNLAFWVVLLAIPLLFFTSAYLQS